MHTPPPTPPFDTTVAVGPHTAGAVAERSDARQTAHRNDSEARARARVARPWAIAGALLLAGGLLFIIANVWQLSWGAQVMQFRMAAPGDTAQPLEPPPYPAALPWLAVLGPLVAATGICVLLFLGWRRSARWLATVGIGITALGMLRGPLSVVALLVTGQSTPLDIESFALSRVPGATASLDNAWFNDAWFNDAWFNDAWFHDTWGTIQAAWILGIGVVVLGLAFAMAVDPHIATAPGAERAPVPSNGAGHTWPMGSILACLALATPLVAAVLSAPLQYVWTVGGLTDEDPLALLVMGFFWAAAGVIALVAAARTRRDA